MAGPAMKELHSSRGAAFGDFDNDGDIDILVMNMNEPPSLFRNDVSGTHHWLKVLLEGVESNRSRDRRASNCGIWRIQAGADGTRAIVLSLRE